MEISHFQRGTEENANSIPPPIGAPFKLSQLGRPGKRAAPSSLGRSARNALDSRIKMATPDDLVDAKIGKSAAETETKIARLEGKLDLVLLKLDAGDKKLDAYNATAEAIRREVKDSERAVRANGWVIFAAISGLIIGVVAIVATVGPFLFEQGAKQDELATRKANEALQRFIQQSPVTPQK
jgi:hypothetical protein